jgi:LysR family cys regulon transcriptional activator
MKLNELRSVRAVVASGFRITGAAESIHVSQPGISRHVQKVESHLGVQLFERHRNRLTQPTAAGELLLPAIQKVLEEFDSLYALAAQFANGARGSLTVATSHTHARYLLPPALKRFIKDYPSVRVLVRQGTLDQIVEWMQAGEADLSLSAAPLRHAAALEFFPLCNVDRLVLVPTGHPLLKRRKLSLSDLSSYPLITYGSEFAAHAQISKAFKDAGLKPTMALNTSDTDTIKTYALCGLGVAIVAHTAFEPQQDHGLRAIDARHLFPSIVVSLGVNRERSLSAHALRLARLLAPGVARAILSSDKS